MEERLILMKGNIAPAMSMSGSVRSKNPETECLSRLRGKRARSGWESVKSTNKITGEVERATRKKIEARPV